MRRYVTELNPLVLITFGLASLLGSLFVRSLSIGLISLACYAVLAAMFLPSWRYPAVCLAFCAFAGLTIMYSTWRLGGRDLEVAATAGLRIVVLAWPGSVMAGYLDPSRLGDYLAQNLRLPARGAAAFSAALQRFTGLSNTWTQLERTRRARGTMPGRNPVALVRHGGSMSFGLLVQAMRGATASSIAMDARGFASARRRTWAEPATWTRADAVGMVAAIGLALVPAVLYLAR